MYKKNISILNPLPLISCSEMFRCHLHSFLFITHYSSGTSSQNSHFVGQSWLAYLLGSLVIQDHTLKQIMVSRGTS